MRYKRIKHGSEFHYRESRGINAKLAERTDVRFLRCPSALPAHICRQWAQTTSLQHFLDIGLYSMAEHMSIDRKDAERNGRGRDEESGAQKLRQDNGQQS
jgi:hypothetical protein